MEEKLGIITKEDLEVLSKQVYESAKSKGFYPDTGIANRHLCDCPQKQYQPDGTYQVENEVQRNPSVPTRI